MESTPKIAVYNKVKQGLNYLNEAIGDDMEHLAFSIASWKMMSLFNVANFVDAGNKIRM